MSGSTNSFHPTQDKGKAPVRESSFSYSEQTPESLYKAPHNINDPRIQNRQFGNLNERQCAQFNQRQHPRQEHRQQASPHENRGQGEQPEKLSQKIKLEPQDPQELQKQPETPLQKIKREPQEQEEQLSQQVRELQEQHNHLSHQIRQEIQRYPERVSQQVHEPQEQSTTVQPSVHNATPENYPTASNNQSVEPDQTIARGDFPVLNIKITDKKLCGNTSFEDIYSFIYAFQRKLVVNRMLPLDDYWEKHLRMACRPQQISWFERVFANRDLTWEMARDQLEKEYGDPTYMENKKRSFKNISQRRTEPIPRFADRFIKLMKGCGIQSKPSVVKQFVEALLLYNRKMVHDIIASNFGLKPTEDMELIVFTVIKNLDDSLDSIVIPEKKSHHGLIKGTRYENIKAPKIRSRRGAKANQHGLMKDFSQHPNGNHPRGGTFAFNTPPRNPNTTRPFGEPSNTQNTNSF